VIYHADAFTLYGSPAPPIDFYPENMFGTVPVAGVSASGAGVAGGVPVPFAPGVSAPSGVGGDSVGGGSGCIGDPGSALAAGSGDACAGHGPASDAGHADGSGDKSTMDGKAPSESDDDMGKDSSGSSDNGDGDDKPPDKQFTRSILISYAGINLLLHKYALLHLQVIMGELRHSAYFSVPMKGDILNTVNSLLKSQSSNSIAVDAVLELTSAVAHLSDKIPQDFQMTQFGGWITRLLFFSITRTQPERIHRQKSSGEAGLKPFDLAISPHKVIDVVGSDRHIWVGHLFICKIL
jgi:hypothetical protein